MSLWTVLCEIRSRCMQLPPLLSWRTRQTRRKSMRTRARKTENIFLCEKQKIWIIRLFGKRKSNFMWTYTFQEVDRFCHFPFRIALNRRLSNFHVEGESTFGGAHSLPYPTLARVPSILCIREWGRGWGFWWVHCACVCVCVVCGA